MPETEVIEFDDNGVPVGTTPEAAASEPAETAEPETEGTAPQGKYRIGERTFDKLEEAHAYASTHIEALETQTAIADAYRQGSLDARGGNGAAANVTPEPVPEDDINEEEFYANPKEFLKKFATDIKAKAVQTMDQQLSVKQQEEQIWSEFTQRHPDLADFRAEVEQFAGQNKTALSGISQTKGRGAGFDFVALKLREQFSKYAQAAKPKRVLSNGGAGVSPTSKGASVTPKPGEKKPLSFAEQIKLNRKVK